MGFLSKIDGVARVLVTAVVLVVIAGLLIVFYPRTDKMELTASFPRTVSLYEGSDVRILGVPVGKVESVRPAGTDVVVKMWYEAKYKVPDNAQAVIISPAIVGDRFVQLTPVFRKGDAAMRDGAVLTTKSTSTPLELDTIYQGIDELSVALGPQGANSTGSLSRLLNSTAKNFEGEGAQFHDTITNVSRLTSTLDDNKEELFGTAREVERFVNALAKNDTTVRRFNDSLASAADLLENERSDLAAALRNLGVAMKAVEGFVKENRSALTRNIKGLNQVSKVLVKQRDALNEVLQVAPTTLANLYHTYNPSAGTLDTRTNLGQNISDLTSDPAQLICGVLKAAKKDTTQTCDALENLFKALPKPPSAPRAAALAGASASTTGRQVEDVDRSLGGILRADR